MTDVRGARVSRTHAEETGRPTAILVKAHHCELPARVRFRLRNAPVCTGALLPTRRVRDEFSVRGRARNPCVRSGHV